MSITDELREWAKTLTHWWYDPVKDEYTYTTGTMPPSIDAIRLDSSIIAIADRIDAEHERVRAESILDMTDERMAEHGWIRLPKDAEGEYVRVGDVVNSKVDHLFDGRPFKVRALVLCEDGWEAADGRFGNRYEPDSLRHYHTPTVEDVLREFGIDWEYEIDCEDRAALLKEYASKLRLAEGEDA